MKKLIPYLTTGAIAIVAVIIYNKFIAPKTGISA
jgi:hypothetical protein